MTDEAKALVKRMRDRVIYDSRHYIPDPLLSAGADLIETQAREIERLRAERDTPHVSDFLEAVKLEAAHQRERWGSDHDAGKTPFDWFWLIGYLAQKAADAATRGDAFKALHHTISTAAALANWHSAMAQVDNTMRPGIVPDDEAQARAALGEKQ